MMQKTCASVSKITQHVLEESGSNLPAQIQDVMPAIRMMTQTVCVDRLLGSGNHHPQVIIISLQDDLPILI